MTRSHLAAIRDLIRRCVASMLRLSAPAAVRVEFPAFVPHDAFGEPLALA